MPNKKKSARPVESGWLMQVGVVGIDKTLKLLKLTGWDLLKVEQALRRRLPKDVNPLDMAKLPWLKIPLAEINDEWEKPPAWLLRPWEKVLAYATKKKGSALTKEEWEDLGMEWSMAASDYPGREEWEHLEMALDEFTLLQRRHGLSRGKGREKAYRPSLDRWFFDANTLKLFRLGPLDNDTERKKFERIRAHSLALAEALNEISGKCRAKSAHYPEKIAEVIKHSRALTQKRSENIAEKLVRAKTLIKEHDERRLYLLRELQRLRKVWKKVGGVRGRNGPTCSC